MHRRYQLRALHRCYWIRAIVGCIKSTRAMIPGKTNPSKRSGATRSGGWAVPVDNARAHVASEHLKVLFAAADQTSRQSEPSLVSKRDRLYKIPCPIYGQKRPEDLLIGHPVE